MTQDLTNGKVFEINQIFIKVVDYDQDINIMYSFPGTTINDAKDKLYFNQNRIDQMYDKIKKERKVIIDYTGFDYETRTKRCVRTGHPIIIDD